MIPYSKFRSFLYCPLGHFPKSYCTYGISCQTICHTKVATQHNSDCLLWTFRDQTPFQWAFLTFTLCDWQKYSWSKSLWYHFRVSQTTHEILTMTFISNQALYPVTWQISFFICYYGWHSFFPLTGWQSEHGFWCY